VARHARLRLVEDLGEVGDGEIAPSQQRQDAQAAGFGRRLQRINHGIEGYGRSGKHAFSQKDIKISLCDFQSIGNRDVVLGKEDDAAVSGEQVMTLPTAGRWTTEVRDGELPLSFDPAALAGDAHLVFIGRIRSPWQTRDDCPKNMHEARETGQRGSVEIDEAYRAGLAGLERASHVVILTWFDRAARNLIVQKPRRSPRASGTFALRSPVRPNPIGLHVAKLVSLDRATGTIGLDAIDVLDGTPVIDVKPYFASIDAFPEAAVRRADD
jgi:tRNA-Thr(GGU) m(6)t(6)A37 methyltransferase TsaA